MRGVNGLHHITAIAGPALVLPPWLEAHRAAIEHALPPLAFSTPVHAKP